MRFLVLLFLVILFPTFALAGPLEDGETALGKQDYQTALKLLEPLADQGNTQAQYLISHMYRDGWGVKPDRSKADHWMAKATSSAQKMAMQGDAAAQLLLGGLYEDGDGVKKDTAQAFKWLQKSAEGGNAQAQAKLGMQYAVGCKGTKQDYAEALKWDLKAAEQGVTYVFPDLGRFYSEGLGVQQNWYEAYYWYSLRDLVEPGLAHVYATPKKLAETHLQPQQIDAVKNRLEEWKQFHQILDSAVPPIPTIESVNMHVWHLSRVTDEKIPPMRGEIMDLKSRRRYFSEEGWQQYMIYVELVKPHVYGASTMLLRIEEPTQNFSKVSDGVFKYETAGEVMLRGYDEADIYGPFNLEVTIEQKQSDHKNLITEWKFVPGALHWPRLPALKTQQ